jgi:hypothetical protein
MKCAADAAHAERGNHGLLRVRVRVPQRLRSDNQSILARREATCRVSVSVANAKRKSKLLRRDTDSRRGRNHEATTKPEPPKINSQRTLLLFGAGAVRRSLRHLQHVIPNRRPHLLVPENTDDTNDAMSPALLPRTNTCLRTVVQAKSERVNVGADARSRPRGASESVRRRLTRLVQRMKTDDAVLDAK